MTGSTHQRHGTAPAHILIAEDSPTQARRLMHTLQQRGYQASTASNGREALELARRLRPALVISDVVMPEVDGYTLTRMLKADAELGGMPVILVTTMSDPQDVIRGLECGADCFILKPYDEDHLVGRIQYILLNRQFRRVKDAGMGVEIHFNGQRHYITADRLQILDLLLSTYDAAIQRNQELRQSKQALEATTAEVQAGHRFLDSMIENLPVPILVQDAVALRYVRLNRAAEALFGCDKSELVGQTAFDLFSAPQAELLSAAGRRVLQGRAIEDIAALRVATRHHGVRHLHTRMVPVLDAFGDPSHLLVMCDDITASVQAQSELENLNAALLRQTEELERARAAAEEGTRAKSAFLAAVSHEIRTPMNGVIGMLDVLHQSSLRGDQVEMVDLIRDSANALLAIIEDILDFSKIEAGKLDIDAAPMNVEDIVEKACGLLDKLALKKGVELTMFFDPAIPEQVVGDALRLRQVLINLIGNAIKFSSGEGRRGRVTVDTRWDTSHSPPVLQCTVRDNGIGIDEATQARLFHSFAQADAATTRRFGGTGLGLAISHRLMTLMGGTIAVRSSAGHGATFTVRLPCEAVGSGRGALPLGHLAGLRCIVAGQGDLAERHAVYLRHEGAAVERVDDLAAAHARTLAQPQPVPMWIVESSDAPQNREVLAALAGAEEAARPAAVVLVERGRRRAWRIAPDGWAVLDGNVLGRRRFVQGVAAAAGRLPRVAESPAVVATGKPLSRADAVRRGRLVLVAEDNPTNQKVVQRQLTLLGVAADIAGDGREALRRWRMGTYAAVLTDVHMPVMDGYELAAAIRAEEQGGRRRTPIVGLSANAVKDEAQRCRAQGMDDYLSKPVRLQLLGEMLERWLPGREAPAHPGAEVPGAAPVLDARQLVPFVGNDQFVLEDLLQEFRRGAAQALAQVLEAHRRRDADVIVATAHRLRSSASAIGADGLGRLCEGMEAAGGRADWTALSELLPVFAAEVGQVQTHAQTW